jgi:hypothetical protein
MRASLGGASGAVPVLGVEALESTLAEIEENALDVLRERFERIETEFDRRLDRAHRSFLERATAALIAHLERNGDDQVWEYDPSGLRMLLRTAYQVFAAHTHREVQASYDDLAAALAGLWHQGFDGLAEGFRVEPPQAPRVPPPVQIGQTIALDLKGSWWRRWWHRRRGYQSFAADFSQMIAAETRPMVDDLGHGLVRALCEDAVRGMREFLASQHDLIVNAAAPGTAGDADDGAERLEAGLAHIEAVLDEIGE